MLVMGCVWWVRARCGMGKCAIAVARAALTVAAWSTAPDRMPQPSRGTLSGHMIRSGGPQIGDPVPMPGKVTITGNAGSRDVIVGDDGAFSLSLPPRRCTALAHPPSEPVGGGQVRPCPDSPIAVITVGAATAVDAMCLLL